MFPINRVVECFVRGGKVFIEESGCRDSYYWVKNQLVSSDIQRICLSIQLREFTTNESEAVNAPVFCIVRNPSIVINYSSLFDEFIHDGETEYSDKIKLKLYDTYSRRVISPDTDPHESFDLHDTFWLDLNNGVFFMLNADLQDQLFNKYDISQTKESLETLLV